MYWTKVLCAAVFHLWTIFSASYVFSHLTFEAIRLLVCHHRVTESCSTLNSMSVIVCIPLLSRLL